ncbi:MAG: hypothetical protein DCC73_12235 [Proteobacteria bacterium]|nr:MAG: hypothetical protein DCC73_12235 [Pseudomonadota bacterium]
MKRSSAFLPSAVSPTVLCIYLIISPTPVVMAADTSSVWLEEIVVSSRKREENLQTVPDAITAFSERAIESAGIEKVDDFLALTPNFEIRNDQQPGVFTMTVRGVSQVRNGEPPVAFVIDGVTLPSVNAFTQDLYDVERIEVLKGPQGALYGRNAIGGAINVITKQPSNELEGFVKARAGKGNDFKVSAGVSGAIVEDKILARVSGYYHNSDGLLNNVYLNQDADWEESGGFRARVVTYLNDNLTLDVRGSYNKLEAGSAYYVNTESTFIGNAVGIIQSDVAGEADVEMWDISAKLDWETSAGTLTSITGYNDVYELNYQDIDWTPISFLEGYLLDDVQGFTQEIRFTSPSDQRFRWFVGSFYQNIDKYRLTDAYVNLNFILNGDGDPADKILVPAAYAPQEQDYVTYSLFGQINYDITDQLELTLALRWDRDERNDFQANAIPGGLASSATFEEIQPKVSLAYKPNDDLLLYATAARGYRPGGFNPPNTIQDAYGKETLNSYELGVKSTLAEGRVRFNAAAFYVDYSNQQFFLLEVTPSGGLVQLLANGQSSETYGFEAELTASVLDGLDLAAGFGYTDGKIKDFGSFATFPGGTDRFDGNKLPNTSKYTLNLSVQYTLPLNDELNLVSRIDFRRMGKTYWALDNVDTQGGYNLVDLRMGIENDAWRLTAYGKNVFDVKYTEQAFIKEFSGFVTDTAWPSKPASWGIEGSYKF